MIKLRCSLSTYSLLRRYLFKFLLVFRCLAFTPSNLDHWSRNRSFASIGQELGLLRTNECRVVTQSCKLVVKVIAIEEGLYRISSEHKHILLELFIFLIFPVLINILLVEVIFLWWDEGRFHLAVPQVLPRKVLEPWMILDFLRTIEPKSVHRFTLDHLKLSVNPHCLR